MNYDNPFPGMNPYLEQPWLWPEVHNEMIALLWSSLGLQIPFGYRLAIEQRLELWEAPFVDDRPRFVVPDLSVTERGELQREVALKERTIPEDGLVVMTPVPTRVTYLEARTASGQVVTVVEILSPTNKAPGSGRADYLRKREGILASDVNLVEIDLLRGGQSMPLATVIPDYHYRILVSRAWQRPSANLFPFTVQEAIPQFPLPLRADDDELRVDLGELLERMHRTARYNDFVDYSVFPPAPTLDEETQRWVDERLAAFQQAA